MGILIKGMDEIPEDGAVLVVKHDNGKAYIKHACTYGYSMELVKLPAVQPDHNADVSKKVDMMHEYIYKIVKDCDGVNCYIKQGKIIRCKDCDWWTKQEDSVQGRCELMQMYPAGGWYCGNARRRPE